MFRDEYTLLALSMVSGSGHCYWDPEPEYVVMYPPFLANRMSAGLHVSPSTI